MLIIKKGDRTRLLFYGDLAWALFQRLPNMGITRVATHLKGTGAPVGGLPITDNGEVTLSAPSV